MFHEYPCKHAYSLFDRHAFFIIDPDPLHATAWRITLKNKTVKTFLLKLNNAFLSPADHAFGHILLCPYGNQSGRLRISLQMHGFSWDGKTTFNLGTYRDILHILSQRVGEETIQFVASIITDIFSQQTGADSKFNLFHGQYPLISKTGYEKGCSLLIFQIFKTEALLQFFFFE